jgi:hypothetical protein
VNLDTWQCPKAERCPQGPREEFQLPPGAAAAAHYSGSRCCSQRGPSQLVLKSQLTPAARCVMLNQNAIMNAKDVLQAM